MMLRDASETGGYNWGWRLKVRLEATGEDRQGHIFFYNSPPLGGGGIKGKGNGEENQGKGKGGKGEVKWKGKGRWKKGKGRKNQGRKGKCHRTIYTPEVRFYKWGWRLLMRKEDTNEGGGYNWSWRLKVRLDASSKDGCYNRGSRIQVNFRVQIVSVDHTA